MKYKSFLIPILLTIIFALGQKKVSSIELPKKEFKYSKTQKYDVKAFRDFIYEKKLSGYEEEYNNKDSSLTISYTSGRALIDKKVTYYDEKNRVIKYFYQSVYRISHSEISEYEYFDNNAIKKKTNYAPNSYPFIKNIKEYNIQGNIVKESNIDENNKLLDFALYIYDNSRLLKTETYKLNKNGTKYLEEAVLYIYNEDELIEKENYFNVEDLGNLNYHVKIMDKAANQSNRYIYKKEYKGLQLESKTIYINGKGGNKTELEIRNDKSYIRYRIEEKKIGQTLQMTQFNPETYSEFKITNEISNKDFSFGYIYDMEIGRFKNIEATIKNENELKNVKFVDKGNILEENIIEHWNTEYEYDVFGNWIKEKQYTNNNLTEISEREIFYK